MAASLENLFRSGHPGVEAEWDLSRFVASTSAFHGIGWPWEECCGRFTAQLLDSEIQVTRTYDDRPDETDAWTAGAGAYYIDYSGLGAHLQTEKADWRFKLGYDFAGVLGENFPTTQTVRVHYGFVTRDDTTAIVTRGSTTADISLSAGTTRALTALIEIAAPTTFGETIELSGPIQHPAIQIQRVMTSATREKWGFREYGPPSSPPKFYSTETATGTAAACAPSGIAAKDFAGDQTYSLAGALTDDRSVDALADGYYSELRNRRNPSLEMTWGTVSGTAISRDLTFACAGEPAPGSVTLTLTDEIATADITGPVNTAIAAAPGSASGGATFDAPLVLSYRTLATDESHYERAVSDWRFALDFTDMEDAPTGGDTISIGVSGTLVTIDRRTGARSTAPVTGTVASDHADLAEATSRLADAAEGDLILIQDIACTGSPLLVADGPYIVALTGAVPVFP